MFQIIKQDILKFFYMYVEQGSICAFFIFVLTFLFGICYVRKSEKTYCYIMVFVKSVNMALLALYIYIVLGITLLSRDANYEAFVNLRLLSTFNCPEVEPIYIYENILLFFPFAILMYALAAPFRNIKISFLSGVCFSLFIEVMQLLTQLGNFVLDDILTNTLGMLGGYFLCKIFCIIF